MGANTERKKENHVRLIVFGGSGDLMTRYLGPALLDLEEAETLPSDLTVIGASRETWTEEEFRTHVTSALSPKRLHGPAYERLCKRLRFEKVDATDVNAIRKLIGGGPESVIAYLALPPAIAGETLEAFATIGLPDRSRIAVEKPFGEDLESARMLNERIDRHFDEDAVFRIDHFLGMPAVRNLLPLRFANALLFETWDRNSIERVEITWDESNTLEGRAGYYDSVGALKDMVQNHLLQVLCLVAMEPPASLEACDVRAARATVLRCIPSLSPAEAAQCSVRARYAEGRAGQKRIDPYVGEEGVDASKQTETFVELVLRIENERWYGVPFVIRTGKGLAGNRRSIDVVLRPARCPLYSSAPGSRLHIGLEPETVGVTVNVLTEEYFEAVGQVSLHARMDPETMSAYARVLRNILSGDPATSVGAGEAEEAWRVVEPFSVAFQQGMAPLLEYPAGTDGPHAAARCKRHFPGQTA